VSVHTQTGLNIEVLERILEPYDACGIMLAHVFSSFICCYGCVYAICRVPMNSLPHLSGEIGKPYDAISGGIMLAQV
jgi:hypothetical protein